MIDYDKKLIEWGVKANVPVQTAPDQIRKDLARLVRIAYEAGVADASPKLIECDGAHHAKQ